MQNQLLNNFLLKLKKINILKIKEINLTDKKHILSDKSILLIKDIL
jgi:hypothetical protein